MSERTVELPYGEKVIVPAGLDDVLTEWVEMADGEIADAADDLVVALHHHGLAVVPLTFDKSTAAVALNVYTQALTWKHDAERRAAAIEAELAALQALFVDPPHALLPGVIAGEVSPPCGDGGVRGNTTEAHDPSVAGYRDTSPASLGREA